MFDCARPGPPGLTHPDNGVRTYNHGNHVWSGVRRCHYLLHRARRVPTHLDSSSPQIEQFFLIDSRGAWQPSLHSHLLHIDKWCDDFRRSATATDTIWCPHQGFGSGLRPRVSIRAESESSYLMCIKIRKVAVSEFVTLDGVIEETDPDRRVPGRL